jgi:hypothetical protein
MSRKVAAAFLGLCGLVLLLTWHYKDSWYWIWQRGWVDFGRVQVPIESFSLSRMSTLDFVLKAFGIALTAVAILVWRPRQSD